MAEPLEEQAILVVVALLEGMTGVRPWGGEYPKSPTVSRELPPAVIGIPNYPHLVVTMRAGGSGYDLGEDVDGMVSVGGAIGYKSTFAFDVVGYVQATESVKADTWCLRLRKDVLDTLCGHAEALAGVPQCRSLWPTGETEFDPGVLGERVRAFAQSYALTFDDVMTLL